MNIKKYYLFEAITWLAIVFITGLSILFFPWSVEENILKIILGVFLLFIIFWYLKSRQLFIQSDKRYEKINDHYHAIKESDQILKILGEDLPFGFFMTNADGEIAFISEKMSKIAGYSPSELLGRPANEILKVKLEESAVEGINALHLDKGRHELLTKKNGQKVTVYLTKIVLKSDGHQFRTLYLTQEL